MPLSTQVVNNQINSWRRSRNNPQKQHCCIYDYFSRANTADYQHNFSQRLNETWIFKLKVRHQKPPSPSPKGAIVTPKPYFKYQPHSDHQKKQNVRWMIEQIHGAYLSPSCVRKNQHIQRLKCSQHDGKKNRELIHSTASRKKMKRMRINFAIKYNDRKLRWVKLLKDDLRVRMQAWSFSCRVLQNKLKIGEIIILQ